MGDLLCGAELLSWGVGGEELGGVGSSATAFPFSLLSHSPWVLRKKVSGISQLRPKFGGPEDVCCSLNCGHLLSTPWT